VLCAPHTTPHHNTTQHITPQDLEDAAMRRDDDADFDYDRQMEYQQQQEQAGGVGGAYFNDGQEQEQEQELQELQEPQEPQEQQCEDGTADAGQQVWCVCVWSFGDSVAHPRLPRLSFQALS
jgi:hypothetical protein